MLEFYLKKGDILKNFIVVTFLLLVVTIWYLLSIDYFGIYKAGNLQLNKNRETLDSKESKYLILQQSDKTISAIPVDRVVKYSEKLKKLPFNGVVVAGESFTNRVMTNKNILYRDILKELEPIKDVNFSNQKIFLLVNIDFPADFWNNQVWNRVTKNFANLAKVANELKFEGIVFNTNPKSKRAYKMVNFKFPSKRNIEINSTIFQDWEIKGANYYKNEMGYRNRDYSFLEHTKRVTQLFRKIMVSVSTNYPDITLLVYSGVNLDQHSKHPNVYQKAIFLGLEKGAGERCSIYDMAFVDRRETKEIHFQNSYFWRKYGVAEDRYNDELNSSWQWKIPKGDRESWIKKVKVGFIIDTQRLKKITQITSAIKKALKYSDGYVVLLSNGEDWFELNRRRVKTLKRKIEKILKQD